MSSSFQDSTFCCILRTTTACNPVPLIRITFCLADPMDKRKPSNAMYTVLVIPRESRVEIIIEIVSWECVLGASTVRRRSFLLGANVRFPFILKLASNAIRAKNLLHICRSFACTYISSVFIGLSGFCHFRAPHQDRLRGKEFQRDIHF